MTIREATEQDIPNILKVLKASLGETSSKKTEEVWRYKHLDNPFGKSLVLIAIEKGETIGVRAFMRWKWQKGSEIFSAFRAVDTATHPAHQGKGIFKKLTLRALEIGEINGDHFVFNTPNSQSKPGYLKMGWEEVDKLKVVVKPVNPIYWKKNSKSLGNNKKVDHADNSLDDLTDAFGIQLEQSNKFYTPKDRTFLEWRYYNNPLQDYLINSGKGFYIAGYVKYHSDFKELRIVEIMSTSVDSSKISRSIIMKWAKKFGVQIISFALVENFHYGFSISGKIGPVLTVKNINLEEKIKEQILNLKNWNYSLGDLELF